MGGVCGMYGVYRVLVGQPEGKRSLERPWHRWKDKVDLQEVGWGAWTGLAQDMDRWRALVNAAMNLRVP